MVHLSSAGLCTRGTGPASYPHLLDKQQNFFCGTMNEQSVASGLGPRTNIGVLVKAFKSEEYCMKRNRHSYEILVFSTDPSVLLL